MHQDGVLAKTDYIELGDGEQIPILFEDRSVIALDKPPGWMLVPVTWQKTDRNLPAAILSSIASRAFWARSRNLKFLQNVHRLDAETSGVLLMVRSPGALRPFTELFESRQMEKRYLVVVEGKPKKEEWTCRLPLGPDPHRIGRVRVDSREGKAAETQFRWLETRGQLSLLEAFPLTGRTHQIRVHAAESGVPVFGDTLYGTATPTKRGAPPMGLRSVFLGYQNPFDSRKISIHAPSGDFLRQFGFSPETDLNPKEAPAGSPRPPKKQPKEKS